MLPVVPLLLVYANSPIRFAGLCCTSQVEFVVHALELFRQVDVNDDGGMEWEELVGYIVEAGLSTSG